MKKDNHAPPSGDTARAPITGQSPLDVLPSASRDREARAEIARLLEAISEYERTALLLTAALRLCLWRGDRPNE